MIPVRLNVRLSAAVFALALACAGAARANVKDGVEAWSAGDFARAVAEWKGPAAKGDPDALFNLAQAYRLGRGVPEDLKQAEALYARAAAKGHIKAADNYGLLLFQDGRRQQAMPYVTAAAERGDPRAQYLLGIAHFNGDLVAKDWVRAYALLTLANGAGLPQAGPALRQMDQYVPLADRQQAQSLAADIRAGADARRTSELAAADLGDTPTFTNAAPARTAAVTRSDLPPEPLAQRPAAASVAPSSVAAAEAAVAEAMRATGTESPATAGADFARRASTRPAPAAARPARPAVRAPARAAAPPVATTDGPWKVQLGAFAVPGNADRLWSQLAGRGALAGKSKQTAGAGRLTRLLAAGWPSEAAAQGACKALKASGQSCIVAR